MFRKLRDIAAPSGTPFEHQSIGYAFGYVEAMLEKGHVEAARDKLDWLKNALARTGHTGARCPRTWAARTTAATTPTARSTPSTSAAVGATSRDGTSSPG
ncbi:hypothetical protein AAW14_23195 [Streptomyces hygroscopicus]|uniref:hypothetical protein n=1 Tax=Streptomyces hygroscopicus TaxID=1912 RepID=UPI00223FE967|nr:hypothetical protein [Streptomyces hygroscopicus]MCW7944836.1 hypothetical protein [Streptomyces hygroscopicus]